MSMTLDLLTDEELLEQHHMSAGQPHRNLVTRLYEGLRAVYRDRTDRLVVAEIIWRCPDSTRLIPDIAVVHGVPMGDPESYRIGIDGPPPTVALEVVSPRDDENTYRLKLDRHWLAGTGELWFLHHSTGLVTRWVRGEERWIEEPDHRCDALDGISFDGSSGRIIPRFGDGAEFPVSVSAVLAAVARAEERADTAEARAARLAEQAADASARAAEASALAAEASARAARLAAQLRAAGLDPDA
jgi:Uma2 family endonuclease